MIFLIIGGAKSGKSMYGQNLAKALESNKGRLYYIATMNPYDLEDLKRIENHLKDREGYGFETIEKQRNIEEISTNINKEDTLFIDSITSLVTNEMFIKDKFIELVSNKIVKGLKDTVSKSKNTIIVSDYVFSDSIIYDSYTEAFRKELGYTNKEIAQLSDVVVECSYGNIIVHKGKDILKEIV